MKASNSLQVLAVILLLLGVTAATLAPTALTLAERPQMLADFTVIREDGQWRVPLLEVCFDEATGTLNAPQGIGEWAPTLMFGDCNARFVGGELQKPPHNRKST